MPTIALRLSACSLACALAWPCTAPAAVPPGAAAEILSLQGLGDQRPAAATQWQPARAAQPLAAGDSVRTREAAKMAVLFADQTQVRLHQNTTLQVKSLATPAQPLTRLVLGAGRAWAQTKRADGSGLEVQTPAAVAAIRGTDWDLEVGLDGRTVLTVLSGVVELSNDQGQVRVAANEAALAEVGKAPVRLVLSRPRDRIQWVNALRADPAPHLAAEPLPAPLQPLQQALQAGDAARARTALDAARTALPPAWQAAAESAVLLAEGDTAAARQRLLAQTRAAQEGTPAAAWLMLSDLQLMDGDSAAAEATLRAGLRQRPGHGALTAQLARAQLLADRLDDSSRTLAGHEAAQDLALALVRAELARRRGDAPATLAQYTQATQVAPQDARGWQGLGSAQAEREDTVPARRHLQQALALSARAPGAAGELGTLETLANRFDPAQDAFAQALAANPADYVALTGLGLLHLKRGEPAQALDAFLRAGVMEPRYARAKTWTAVAYYQLGRHADAVGALEQAIALDDKDPVPHLLLARIHTDLFQPGDAVAAAREGVARMPYLKSLNQIANDQQGSANLGASLAFFGLEDWALELAQQSHYPYWGASHLFLADRYPGEFNKNSALMQGFLTDPMAFGASQRHSSLLQQPGVHGSAGLTLEKEFHHRSMPAVTLNGMDNRHVPVSWFLKAQSLNSREPIDVGVSDAPAMRDESGPGDTRAEVYTLGLGLQPTERLNLFAYASHFDMRLRGRNQMDLLGLGQDYEHTRMDHTLRQGAAGLSYRWSPVEQTWFKLGRSLEHTTAANAPALFVNPPVAGVLGLAADPARRLSELQVRHTLDAAPGTRLGATLEHAVEKQTSIVEGYGPVYGAAGLADVMLFAGQNRIDRRYSSLTLALQQALSPAATLDAALGWQRIRHRVQGENMVALVAAQAVVTDTATRHDTEHTFTPRLGLVWRPAAGATLRVAYQDWQRPLSTATLAGVETAGIPVEDRLVQAGGRQRRSVAQLGLELGERTYATLRADHLRIANPGTVGVDLRTPSMPFLEELRNQQTVNLSTADVLEGSPDFERGTLSVLGAGVNHLFSRHWSGYAKYLYQHSRSSYVQGSSGDVLSGRQVPFVPRHTAVLGTTWAGAQGWYLSARAVHRSQRFEDKENLTRRPAGWGLDLLAYWETADKRWIVGVAALNLFAPSSPRYSERYVIDARYRF